jgi:hypothetical protein
MHRTGERPFTWFMFPALTFALIVSGVVAQVVLSDDTVRLAGSHSCARSLHSALKGQNKVQWETSLLADTEVICSTARTNAAHFERAGLSRDDAELATFSAWLQLK